MSRGAGQLAGDGDLDQERIVGREFSLMLGWGGVNIIKQGVKFQLKYCFGVFPSKCAKNK